MEYIKLSIAELREWVRTTTGDFNYKQVLDGKIDPDDYDKLRADMSRLCKEETCEAVKRRGDGWFRYVDKELMPMQLSSANPKRVLDIKLPFGLEKYIKIFRKNVIIVFGSKSAGKTAWCLNLAKLNLGIFPIAYFNSDMGEEEMRMRVEKFDDMDIELWDASIEMYERSYNFEDVIKPDYINIVDFLEVFEEFWRIGEPIKRMADKLNNGILVIAIQKNYKAEWGLGGQRAIEKAKLVINLDPGELILKEAKNWANGLTVSPKGKKWTFQLVNGCKFVNIIEAD